MTSDTAASDAWLSSDEYTTRAAANVDTRAEATAWFRSMTPWFAENHLLTHQGLPVIGGIHWAGDDVWLLATPTDPTGRPATQPREGQAAVLAHVWAPAPTDPPARLRRFADPLPAGAAVPGVRPVETSRKIVRAPTWKAGLARVNRELEDRRDWWEHRSLGIDAQRRRGPVNSSWLDRVRNI